MVTHPVKRLRRNPWQGLKVAAAPADEKPKVRATRAYLAGFGTSGSLLAGAALMFVLASAIVAFRGWPRVAGQNSIVNVSVPRVSLTPTTRTGRILAAATRGGVAGSAASAAGAAGAGGGAGGLDASGGGGPTASRGGSGGDGTP